MRVLAGDIGGTNARIALVDVNDTTAGIVRQAQYPSRKFPGLTPIVEQFAPDPASRPDRACFGLACPVVGDDCTASNLPWTLNSVRLASEIGIPRTRIINDFAALGHGIGLLAPADLVTLQAGRPIPRGPIGLIGAGTGLGQGLMVWGGEAYQVLPSEGGHAAFAPEDELQTGLLQALRARFGRVSWERVLSGPGLLNIYTSLRDAGLAPEQPAVRAELEQEDPPPVIVRHGLDRSDPLCDRTLEVFCQVLGAQAGNLALTLCATGGIYIGGGIAPRLVDRLREGPMLAAFRDKGRLSRLMGEIPLHVIMNPNVGLLGAAAAAARLA